MLYLICFYPSPQTITGAMSTLTPPIQLAEPQNQFRLDYIQDVSSSPDFDYPEVLYLCFSVSATFVLKSA